MRGILYLFAFVCVLPLSFGATPCSADAATSDAIAAGRVKVITNPGVPIDQVNTGTLRAIFGMRNRKWQGGSVIKVFVLPDDDPVHVKFAKEVLNTFPYNLRRIWDRKVFSGTGQSPTVVGSEAEMLEMVSKTENSIGYIGSVAVKDGVNVLGFD